MKSVPLKFTQVSFIILTMNNIPQRYGIQNPCLSTESKIRHLHFSIIYTVWCHLCICNYATFKLHSYLVRNFFTQASLKLVVLCTVRSQLDTVTLKALVKSVMAQLSHWLWLRFLILSYKDCYKGSDQIRRWPPPHVSRVLDWITFTREHCEVMRSSCRIMGLGLTVGSFWGQKCLICDAACICKVTEIFII